MAVSELYSRNDATSINSSHTTFKLTSHGSDWLWAVFAVFALLLLIHGLSYSFGIKKSRARKFLYATPIVSCFALTFAYYSYASNLGWAGVRAEFYHITTHDETEFPGTRQIFYSKFIGWFVAFPCFLFTLEFVRTAEKFNYTTWDDSLQLVANIALEVLAFESFVVSLLVGTLIHSTYKWGYFTFGAVALLFGCSLIISDHFFASNRSKSVLLKLLIPLIIIILILMPVEWGLSEGGNVIQPDSEAVFYGVLDLLLFGFVQACLIYFVPTEDPAHLIEFGSNYREKNGKNFSSPEPRASGDTAVEATREPDSNKAGVVDPETPTDPDQTVAGIV